MIVGTANLKILLNQMNRIQNIYISQELPSLNHAFENIKEGERNLRGCKKN